MTRRAGLSVLHGPHHVDQAYEVMCPKCSAEVYAPCETILTRDILAGVHEERYEHAGFRDWVTP